MIGLLVGRFQPFHNGHLKAIEWAMKKCSRLIILVGSSQKCYELENPFTVGERIEMIQRVLEKRGMNNCMLLSVPDIQNNALWVAHVNSLVPRYDVVFTNNPLAKRLFKDSGKKVIEFPMMDRLENEGTKIRKSMLKDNKWQSLVPEEVKTFVLEIKSIERLKEIINKDIV
ncbi:nicotinamide-nucleotide adenylyltransferase [Candidatus Micrarchaeota archaeon]|nr:nicotinamide-nucleotide adenylyltransferase [Candidatus Micrarchaeota archaeon]